MTLERGRLGVDGSELGAGSGAGSGAGRGMGGLEFAISSERGSMVEGTEDGEAESSGLSGKREVEVPNISRHSVA